jgi:hypothetical protein
MKEAVGFESSTFPSVSDDWLLHFSVWQSGCNKTTSRFRLKCVEVSDTGEVSNQVLKDIYNDDDPLNKVLTVTWLDGRKLFSGKTMVHITNKYEVCNPVKSGRSRSFRIPQGFLGSYSCDYSFYIRSRVPYFSRVSGVLYSSLGSNLSITEDNFDRVIATQATYLSTNYSWIDQRDGLHIPDVTHPQWSKYVSDCIIYVLCHSRTWMFAKYDIVYSNVIYQVPNELFWMSREEVTELAKKYNNAEVLRTMEVVPHERYLVTRLPEILLNCSEVARDMYNAMRECVELSFAERIDFDKRFPHIGVNAWDACWVQLRDLIKGTARDKYNYVKRLQKTLRKQLQTLQYELGWRVNRILDDKE